MQYDHEESSKAPLDEKQVFKDSLRVALQNSKVCTCSLRRTMFLREGFEELRA